MWRRKPGGLDPRITSRTKKLGQGDLISWADQAIYSTGRNLTSYQRTDDETFLEEAHSAAQVLLAIVSEIRSRRQP